jgi:hypothetical protein
MEPNLRHLLSALAALALALWIAPLSAYAANLEPCTYQVGTLPENVKSYLEALRADPFADAYDTYIADLKHVQTDTESWVSDVDEYSQVQCRTYNDAVKQYELDKQVWEASSCRRGPVTQDMVADCNYRHSQLNMRYNILKNREKEIRAIEADFNHRSQALGASAEPAFKHADTVLDPDHVEDALRLYISWMKRAGTSDSCHSLAHIAEKLGQRVTNQWYFLEYLARNLVTSPRRLSSLIRVSNLAPFAFDSSGFKARFRTDLADNQVRHAVAYMVVGYKYQGSGADLVAQLRDELKGEQQDYWLGVEAGHMGFQLRTGTYDTGNFGRAIGGRLCQ